MGVPCCGAGTGGPTCPLALGGTRQSRVPSQKGGNERVGELGQQQGWGLARGMGNPG